MANIFFVILALFYITIIFVIADVFFCLKINFENKKKENIGVKK